MESDVPDPAFTIMNGHVPVAVESHRGDAGMSYIVRIHGVQVGVGLTVLAAIGDAALRMHQAADEMVSWATRDGTF